MQRIQGFLRAQAVARGESQTAAGTDRGAGDTVRGHIPREAPVQGSREAVIFK